jgi:hypothetical protein
MEEFEFQRKNFSIGQNGYIPKLILTDHRGQFFSVDNYSPFYVYFDKVHYMFCIIVL